MNFPLKCNCCQKVYTEIPKEAFEDEYGVHWWDCECKTSMAHIPNIPRTRELMRGESKFLFNPHDGKVKREKDWREIHKRYNDLYETISWEEWAKDLIEVEEG